MSKKLFISLVSLLVTAAFAATGVAQAATPHYYDSNGGGTAAGAAPATAGEKIPVFAWGTLAQSAAGAATTECQNTASGYIENPVGGGPGVGKTESFNAYNCTNEACKPSPPLLMRVIAEKLPWPSVLELSGTKVRANTSGVQVWVGCTFPGKSTAADPATKGDEDPEQEPGAVTCTGEQNPLQIEGTTIGTKPSEILFDVPGTKKLSCEGLGLGTTEKELKIEGYNEEEIVAARNH